MRRHHDRKITIPLLVISLVFVSRLVFAHPPSDLKLSYDKDSQTLHIEMKHVASNTRTQDYIRKIQIYKNQEEPTDLIIVKQTTPNSVAKDVSLSAKGGDMIKVKAFSSQGGSAEETLVVPEDVAPKSTSPLKGTTNNKKKTEKHKERALKERLK